MKTLHLIHGASHCGALKVALHGIAEEPYQILYYPLPLSKGLLPRSTSQYELRRINREYRKQEPIFRYGPELKRFFHPDLSQFDKVVIWWSSELDPSTYLIMHMVCSLYPQCNLYQIEYKESELDKFIVNYPKGVTPISPTVRAVYAEPYNKLIGKIASIAK